MSIEMVLLMVILTFGIGFVLNGWFDHGTTGARQAQSRCKTSFGEFVRVPITRFDLDPTIFNGLVQPSLEIGVSHIYEVIASKYAARTNFVLYENAEDLAPYFFIGCHVIHPCGVSHRRSHKLKTTASDRMELYPSSCRLARRRDYRMGCRIRFSGATDPANELVGKTCGGSFLPVKSNAG